MLEATQRRAGKSTSALGIRVLSIASEMPPTPGRMRVLVERRGNLDRGAGVLRIDTRLEDVAPSPGLDTWFRRTADQWASFCDRYFRELAMKPDQVRALVRLVRSGPIDLICRDGDEPYSAGRALLTYLRKQQAPERSEES